MAGDQKMIAIIDYDAGNLTSVARALSHIGFACEITKDIDEIMAAERIIFSWSRCSRCGYGKPESIWS